MSPRPLGSFLVPLALAALSLSLLPGCNGKAKRAADGPSAAASDVASVRQRYMQVNPDHRVGVVTAVHEPSNHAAVGDVPLQDFGIGDVLVFLDDREQPFNSGEVVNATSTSLHVLYDANRRAPRVGELAVRLAR